MNPEIKIPDLFTAKKILAVQPHYDDNDISVGGTLHLLAQAGAELHYLTATDDLAGVIPQEDGAMLSQEEALALLQKNQEQAARIIGVQNQIRLGFPDAGDYDYYQLRNQIIDHIRQVRPDFLFTVDPWTPYEAHQDHILTGKACAEAAILYNLPAIGDYDGLKMQNYGLEGVVFYNTAYPNLVFNITAGLEVKQEALKAYTAQFSQADLDVLIQQTTFLSGFVAREEPYAFGEAVKVVAPWMLHGVPMTKDL